MLLYECGLFFVVVVVEARVKLPACFGHNHTKTCNCTVAVVHTVYALIRVWYVTLHAIVAVL